jgi:hypothetical protein
MRIKNQDEILELATRKQIIGEIEATENRLRKDEAYRRRQCYKDKTNQEVVKVLNKQFSAVTVDEMTYSITNLSIVKKVIKKLARVYKDGVTRVVPEDKDTTEKIAKLAELFKFNAKMKNQNRITRLQKNAVHYIKPCIVVDKDNEKSFSPRPTILQPYLYDVVEDFYDRSKASVYILSNYHPGEATFTTSDPARIRSSNNVQAINGQVRTNGNDTDEGIADKEEDNEQANGKEYIWWSNNYHFTTNSLGQVLKADGTLESGSVLIVSDDDETYINPIEELPFVPTTVDQDNNFWAEGGEDLIDGSIVVNALMTHNNHVAVTQGYGQYWMSGKNLPDNVDIGPNSLVKMEHEISSEDPEPKFGVLNANPPLSELQESIMAQIALILTTNDLSTSGLSANLDGGAKFAAGVALIIDKAESMEDVSDEREEFSDAERLIWSKIAKFMQYFSEQDELDPALEDLILPEEFDLKLLFGEPKMIFSESEKLDAIQKRKDLGLNTQEELIMKDRTDFDEADAKRKLEEIKKQKKEMMEDFVVKEEPDENDKDKDNKDDNK